MKQILFFLCFVILNGCFTTETENFLPILSIGESRIFERDFSTVNLKTKDTTSSFSIALYEVFGDTVVDGNNGYLVNVTAWNPIHDSMFQTKRKEMILIENGFINVYQFKSEFEDGFLISLFKKSTYDTSIFIDRMHSMKTHLIQNATWLFRDKSDRYGDVPMEMKILGNEDFVFEGKNYNCFVKTLPYYAPIKYWVSNVGVMKAEYTNTIDDSTIYWEKYHLLKMNDKDKIDSIVQKGFEKSTKR
jgi:hypothetical protein